VDQKESLKVLLVETPNRLKFKVLLIRVRATEGCCVYFRVIRGIWQFSLDPLGKLVSLGSARS